MLGRIAASAVSCTLSPSDNQTGVETQPILLLTFYEQHMIVEVLNFGPSDITSHCC